MTASENLKKMENIIKSKQKVELGRARSKLEYLGKKRYLLQPLRETDLGEKIISDHKAAVLAMICWHSYMALG